MPDKIDVDDLPDYLPVAGDAPQKPVVCRHCWALILDDPNVQQLHTDWHLRLPFNRA